MRHTLRNIIVILFTLLHGSTFSQERDLFNRANQQYKDGHFQKAFDLYKQIPNKSAAVNYNIGNCAYKLKKFGQALVYWRRAEKDWGLFNREEIVDNITLLKDEMRKLYRMPVKKHNPIVRRLIKVKNIILSSIRSLPLLLIQLLFIILWLFLFVYLRFLYKKRKHNVIWIFFALIALFGAILIIRYVSESRIYGVIIKREAPLLSGPSVTFRPLLQLHETEEVIVTKESDEYYKVKAQKRIGWVSKENVEKI